MFDKKKKFIYDFNINQLKKLGPYFTIEKLGEVDIHPAISTYVNAAVDNLIFQDRQQLIGNSIFDYSGDEVGGYLASVDDILKRRKKFSLKFFAGLFEEAINFNINYIHSPKPELLNLVFQDKQHLAVQEIIQRLKHIYYYEYFNNVIKSFVSRKKIIALNRDEFNELLNRVDNLSTESNQKEILENFITAASSFFNIGNAGKTDIPLETFTLFVSGKGLSSYQEAVKKGIGETAQPEYAPSFFVKILNTVVEEKVEYVKEELNTDDPGDGLEDFDGGDFAEEIVSEEHANEEILPEPEEDEIPGFESDESPEVENPDVEPETDFESTDEVDIIPGEAEAIEELPNTITSFFGGPADDEEEDTEEREDDPEEFVVTDSINLEDFTEENESPESESLPDEFEEETEVNNDLLFEEGEEEDVFPDEVDEQIPEEIPPVEVDEDLQETLEDSADDESEDSDDNFPDFDFEEEESSQTEAVANDEEDLSVDDNSEDHPEENSTSFNASMGISFSDEDEVTQPKASSQIIDPAEILDHPNMSKIIIEVFDYDMEEFADTMELIAHSETKEKALEIIEQLFERNGVEKSSKEAQNFKEIILDYFD